MQHTFFWLALLCLPAPLMAADAVQKTTITRHAKEAGNNKKHTAKKTEVSKMLYAFSLVYIILSNTIVGFMLILSFRKDKERAKMQTKTSPKEMNGIPSPASQSRPKFDFKCALKASAAPIYLPFWLAQGFPDYLK